MKITVVALGKIGLPLAVQFAGRGHEVIGADVNAAVVDLVNAGHRAVPRRDRPAARSWPRRSPPAG